MIFSAEHAQHVTALLDTPSNLEWAIDRADGNTCFYLHNTEWHEIVLSVCVPTVVEESFVEAANRAKKVM